MEDRHSISEPRPVFCRGNSLPPVWEIDVARDGTVVDTFKLDNEVLPPRRNKKGKIVWRLPDSVEKLPSFGTEDRRRILEIFKERKKKRKQEKRKSQPSVKAAGNGVRRDSNKAESRTSIASQSREDSGSSVNEVTNGSLKPSGKVEVRLSASQRENQTLLPDLSTINLNGCQNSQSSHAPHPQQHTSATQPITFDLPTSDALFITIPRLERPPALPGHPDPSLAVPAARHFISKYYAYFDGMQLGAHLGDLVRYYTVKAQKSISIGGAHSVVAGKDDIATQIQSLAGSSFVVRGVVAQDSAGGKGVHMLVTGVATLNGNSMHFAHSISLVPIDDAILRYPGHRENAANTISPTLTEAFGLGYPYQIHNDALAFLSGDVGTCQQSVAQQPQTTQPVHQPPGLLF